MDPSTLNNSPVQPQFALLSEQGIDNVFVYYFATEDDVNCAKQKFVSARIIWKLVPGRAMEIERWGMRMPAPTIRRAFIKVVTKAYEMRVNGSEQ